MPVDPVLIPFPPPRGSTAAICSCVCGASMEDCSHGCLCFLWSRLRGASFHAICPVCLHFDLADMDLHDIVTLCPEGQMQTIT